MSYGTQLSFCCAVVALASSAKRLGCRPQSTSFALTRPWQFRRCITARHASTGTLCSMTAMEGRLVIYHQEDFVRRVGFISGRHKRHVVLVGGLSDGLIPVPYTQHLATALDVKGWSLVQVLLSSSYNGFGHTTLRTDCAELDLLMKYLEEKEGSEAVGIVGHSTGCQDAVFHLKEGNNKDIVRFVVLQAPASDREHLATNPKTAEFIRLAQELKSQGKQYEMLPREAMWAPITAERFLDLATKEGLDDMFSSDLSDGELRARIGHLNVPTLFLFSGEDEYVPPHVEVPVLATRFVGAVKEPRSRSVIVEGGNHALKGHEDRVVEIILEFMREIGA